MREKVEKWLKKHAPWVYKEGISSMLHAIAVLGAYLAPGFAVGAVLGPILGLVAGVAVGVPVQIWYWKKEFGKNGDIAKYKMALFNSEISQRECTRGIRDSYRDFGMTIFSTVIGVGILYVRVKSGT